ncbi:hypothetical protein CHISP_0618 [Chitinispirillum alkaliphilum]|nr:hypothetical protein CHISP_0618 [Chitinispirillum alkaliphilum]
MLVQVEVVSFAVDPDKNSPLIILQETGGSRSLSVPIAPLDASAIAMHSLQAAEPGKPLTIDLVKLIVDQLGGELARVVIYDYSEQVYLTRLQVSVGDSVKIIDCRPSDAISLALRSRCPILVNDSVFDRIQTSNNLSEAEILRNNISSIETMQFGRYILE